MKTKQSNKENEGKRGWIDIPAIARSSSSSFAALSYAAVASRKGNSGEKGRVENGSTKGAERAKGQMVWFIQKGEERKEYLQRREIKRAI